MNGAESLMRTAAAAGARVCFANPGTTEMQLVAAIDAVPGMRGVLGLFEGVCTGAADGYGRMTGTPALTLLHLGPGFANGIANLHNARRAGSPVLNLIGDHASWHLAADAPLTTDIESLARPVSGFVRTSASAKDLARDTADALAAAIGPPAQVATLVVPQDCQWDEAGGPARLPRPAAPPRTGDAEIAAAAEALRAEGALLFLGGPALGEDGLRAAARIREAAGCRVMHESFFARLERGAGRPAFERLPYFPEQAIEALAGAREVVLVGAREPVAFFGYRGGRSQLLPPEAKRHALPAAGAAAVEVLEALADRLGAAAYAAADAASGARPEPARGELSAGSLGQTLAALQPEGAIVVDEAATSGLGWFVLGAFAPPHTALSLTGGAIGQGLPCAVGAAIACPERRVVAFQADGSGLYTMQALWTMAREGLDVVVVVCANRAYRILQVELARAGIAEPGPGARALTELAPPELDWVSLAKGLGVPGVRVETAEAFADAFGRALAEPGPSLVEALL